MRNIESYRLNENIGDCPLFSLDTDRSECIMYYIPYDVDYKLNNKYELNIWGIIRIIENA